MYREYELLFHKGSVHGVLRAQEQEMAKRIDSLSPGEALGAPSDVLERQLIERFSINVPKLDEAGITVSPPREVEIARQDYGRSYSAKTNEVVFTIPYTGDAVLFDVQPSTFGLVGTRGRADSKTLKMAFQSQDIPGIKAQFENSLKHVRDTLAQMERDFSNFNAQLETTVKRLLAARQQKLSSARSAVEGLGYPIKE